MNQEVGEKNNKIDILWKIIARYDHYINTTNSKASLVAAWNGIVIGTVLLKFEDIIKMYQEYCFGTIIASVCIFSLGFSSLLSNFFIFRVVLPHLSKTNSSNRSLIYFGDVSSLSKEEYVKKILDSDTAVITTDMAEQATILANTLKNKMNNTKLSIYFATFGLLVIYFMLAYKIS